MATHIISGVSPIVPSVRERGYGRVNLLPEEPSPVNAQIARNLELHERGNMYWWKLPTFQIEIVRHERSLARQCLKNDQERFRESHRRTNKDENTGRWRKL